MKLALVLFLMASAEAFAGVEGNYACANLPGLPDNTYSIQMTTVGSLENKIPYVIAERFYRANLSDSTSPIKKSVLSGLAAVSDFEQGKTLILGVIKIDIVDDAIKGCKKVN